MYNLRYAGRPAPPAVRALALGTSLFATAAQAGSVPVTTEFSALTSANRGEFGSAVAVLGERVFVSAPAADIEIIPVVEGGVGPITISDAGVATRWERNANGRFAEVGDAILPATVQPNGRFGTDMATSADLLAITQANPPMLAIYQIGASASLQANLPLPQLGAQGNSTRVSTSILGNTAVAGIVRNFNNNGSVEIFSFSGGQWISTLSLEISSPTDTDIGFGHAVQLAADRLFIGAPYFQPVGGEDFAGAVLEYRRVQAGWTLNDILVLPGDLPSNQPARLGFSLHSAENLLVMGAPQLATSAGGIQIGGVLVYERNTSSNDWELRASIPNPFPEAGAEFGHAVATDGARILVGAPGSNGDNGRSYLFERTGPGQWTLVQGMGRTAVGTHGFGTELAITETSTSIIAAPQFTQFGGAAYEHRFIRLFADGFE